MSFPTALRVFYITVIHRVFFFYLKEWGALSPWAGMQMPHSSDRPPPPGIAVKLSPRRPGPRTQQNPFKAVTQHAFFSLPHLMASLYACFCFSVINVIKYICWALWFLRYVSFCVDCLICFLPSSSSVSYSWTLGSNLLRWPSRPSPQFWRRFPPPHLLSQWR